MKKFLQKLFSVKNEYKYKIWTVLGFRFKFKNYNLIISDLRNELDKKINNLSNETHNLRNDINFLRNDVNLLRNEQCTYKNTLQNIQTHILDNLIRKRLTNGICNYTDFIKDLFENQTVRLAAWKSDYNDILKYYNILFHKSFYVQDNINNSTINIFWGSQFFVNDNVELLADCLISNKSYCFAEMGFLHRISYPSQNYKYSNGISFMFDDLAPYYDARYKNRLENMLNDKNLIISEDQKGRARRCIDKIVETHLTKYNHQPIFEPIIGRKGVEKVLVIDQTYGDMSIVKGLANDNTFKEMLEAAIKENPDADIIVKTHPDTKNGCRGYYTELKSNDNIYLQTEPINPIALIKYVDKVYVCTSQFGFEALMCGKEVHVFGMPFYAGWGLTFDRQNCERRTNTRTLEEVFYIAYIMYTYYVNPDKQCRCEIEEAIDYLLKLRDEYFREQ